jgi:protocatechuate 3,4-dioxygenase beta subunit
LSLPIGISFYSKHFQGGFLYQYSRDSGAFPRSDELRASLGTQWSGFHLSGFVDHQTQAPTIGFILAGVPELQEALDNLALSATTPEQIALALRETGGLANQGFIQNVNINLSPMRLQAGTDLTWSKPTPSRQQFHLDFLYNRNDLLQGANQAVIGSLSYSLKFRNANEFFISSSLLRTNTLGSPSWQTSPLLELSFRRMFASVPNFIIPRRRGTIHGVVFADDGATGTYRPGGPLLADVEVVLDDTRRIRTDHSGHFVFWSVSYGFHYVEVDYRSASPFFLTTASRVQTDADSEVNFGIGLSLARLSGSVRSDAGIGLSNIEINISRGSQHFSAQTDAEGEFHLRGLSPGEYEVKLDINSVPPGYSFAELETRRTTVEASAPAQVAFTLKAIRNISGRVTIYDRASHQVTPVPGITVLLRELSRTSVSDKNGIYLFRDLSPGPYNLIVLYQGKEFRRDVVLPDTPVFPKDIEINLGAK